MTFVASNPLCDMPLVREKNKVGHVVNLGPLKRIALRDQLLHFLDVRAVGLHDRMAIHADIHARDRGVARFVDRRVAILAIDLELAGVEFVAERDRLFRRISPVVTEVIPEG